MSEPEKNSKTKKSDKKSRDWIIRGVVFGVLGILLIMALLDFGAKQSAAKTAEAWRAALRAKGEDGDLTKSELEKIRVSGVQPSASSRHRRGPLKQTKSTRSLGKGRSARTP